MGWGLMEGGGERRDHWDRRAGVVSLGGGVSVGVGERGVGWGADSNGWGGGTLALRWLGREGGLTWITEMRLE